MIKWSYMMGIIERCLVGINATKEDWKDYDRVYLGEEACDTFFLSHTEKIIKMADILTEQGKPITLVLPVVNEVNFSKIINFIHFYKEHFDGYTDVICNDIGTIKELNDIGFPIGFGRIFCRSHMNLLKCPDNIFTREMPYVERIEIDASSLKYLPQLEFKNVSLISSNVIYGYSNDRCPYHAVLGKRESRTKCSLFCKKVKSCLNNKYVGETFEFYHNMVIRVGELGEVPRGINRLIRYKKEVCHVD